MALYLRSSLEIGTSKNTAVIQLSITETIQERGMDYLNALISIYNHEGIVEKNSSAISIGHFIDQRLDSITKTLNNIYTQIELYKKNEKLTELKSNSALSLLTNSEYQKELVKINTQLSLVTFLRDYLLIETETNRSVPANLGITDPILQRLIVDYNNILFERNRLLESSTINNPTINDLDLSLKNLHNNLISSISGIIESLVVTKNDIEKQLNSYEELISNVPRQERELNEQLRSLKVLEDLFVVLSRKKEESALSLAAPVNKARIIDDPISSDRPISPRRKLICLFAIGIGLVLPIGGIYVYDLLMNKVRSRRDLEKRTSLPILGEIPINLSNDIIAIQQGKNDAMAEAFRTIRTNLIFVDKEKSSKRIMVTSSMPGEGKTFIAINLAISFALINKKVLLVGLDVRKPMLAACLNLNPKRGITNFLAGLDNDIYDLVQPSGIHDGLDVLTSGIIPPNPAELLQSESLDKAINALNEKYDYIIIDSAPVGLVTDSIIINRIADYIIYVTRVNYTRIAHLEWVKELSKENKLQNLSLVLNAVKMDRYKHYGYGEYERD